MERSQKKGVLAKERGEGERERGGRGGRGGRKGVNASGGFVSYKTTTHPPNKRVCIVYYLLHSTPLSLHLLPNAKMPLLETALVSNFSKKGRIKSNK
jgi:hypothetical protein